MRQRLQKIISDCGVCSRRSAEKLITEGRVLVNGAAASLGDSADPDTDEISVNGVLLRRPSEKTYIMLNKPRGYVTTLSDEKGRPSVQELVSNVGTRVYPVGRLDMYSDGLLLMTDDGQLAYALTHPSHEVQKTYNVRVEGKVSIKALGILCSPLVLDGRAIKPAKVSLKSTADGSSLISVTITEGRNRQVRRMCEAAGLRVLRLSRVSEGTLALGALRPGKWRFLTDGELAELQKSLK